MGRKKAKTPVAPAGGWPGQRKAPAAAQPIAGAEKRPATASDAASRDEIMARNLVWKFEDVDHDGPWAFDALTAADTADLVQKLGSFESMTIRDVFYKGDEPGKHYDVDDMPEAAQRALLETRHSDATKLARLRLSGAKRLYGVLYEHTFKVLWWDPRHEVFPSPKKHT